MGDATARTGLKKSLFYPALASIASEYVEARDSGKRNAIFNQESSLDPVVKDIVQQYVHSYFDDDSRYFDKDGKELKPNDMTAEDGFLLCRYIISMGECVVLLAPMCQRLLQDETLRGQFEAEAQTNASAKAWENQSRSIKKAAAAALEKALLEKANAVEQGKLRLLLAVVSSSLVFRQSFLTPHTTFSFQHIFFQTTVFSAAGWQNLK